MLRGNALRKRWKRIIIIGHVIPDPFTGLVPITRGSEAHKTRPTFAQRFPRRAYPAEYPAPLVKVSRIAASNSFPRRPGLFTASKNTLLGLTWPQSGPLLSKRKINRGCAAFDTGTYERSERNKKISSFVSQPRFQFSQFRLSTDSTVPEISQGLSGIFERAISYGRIFSVATRSFLSALILLVLLSLVGVTKYARVSRLNGRHLFLTSSITPFLFDFHSIRFLLASAVIYPPRRCLETFGCRKNSYILVTISYWKIWNESASTFYVNLRPVTISPERRTIERKEGRTESTKSESRVSVAAWFSIGCHTAYCDRQRDKWESTRRENFIFYCVIKYNPATRSSTRRTTGHASTIYYDATARSFVKTGSAPGTVALSAYCPNRKEGRTRAGFWQERRKNRRI